MVVIPVVAVCCIGGDAGRILPCESFPGLIKAGVHLQGQRLLCGQELGEKRQPWAEFGEAFRAQAAQGIRGDQRVQWLGDTVGVDGCGGRVRVGSDPHFGFGTT